MERFKIVPACYLVLVKDGKMLLSRRFNTGYEDGNYSFVAGHLNGNETFRQAMAREAKEEAGIVIDPEKLKIIHVMHRAQENSTGERVDILMTIAEWVGEIKNNEPEKCDDLSWFLIDEIPDNVVPFLKQAINCVNKGIFYSEFGFV
ncbi:MAG: hypothetical protein YFSK_2920 [Candidatus Yanofskyibacterium parasiticum]|nr:MAG: hypothetical protein YFSK_2920 [Candidatus Yanofskybacteria bacterium]